MLDNFTSYLPRLDMPVSSSSLIFEEQMELENLEPCGKHQSSTEMFYIFHIVTMFVELRNLESILKLRDQSASGHGVFLPFLCSLFTQFFLDCRTSNVKLREPVYEQGILVAGNKIFSSICNMKQSYSLHVCSDGLTPVVVSKGIIQEILKMDLRSGF